MKVKYDENWALNIAVSFAAVSPCQSKRGVVIWNRNTGFYVGSANYPPSPFVCDGSDACKAQCSKTAVHAEQRALLLLIAAPPTIGNELEMIHVKVIDEKPVFSEKPSCWQCSKLILAAGIKYMWLYQKEGLVKYTVEEFHRLTLLNNSLQIVEK